MTGVALIKGFIAAGLAFCVCGCSNTAVSSSEAAEPTATPKATTVSELFQPEERTLWFQTPISSDMVTPKTGINYVYVFEDGYVTEYLGYDTTKAMTFNDIDGKSDDEIINMAKEKDAAFISAGNTTRKTPTKQKLYVFMTLDKGEKNKIICETVCFRNSGEGDQPITKEDLEASDWYKHINVITFKDSDSDDNLKYVANVYDTSYGGYNNGSWCVVSKDITSIELDPIRTDNITEIYE